MEADALADERGQAGRRQGAAAVGGHQPDADGHPGRAVPALTHASFFSGVGGLDLGLERAGWRTVSFSEIEPYACAVLAERWPDVPNLGDIVELRSDDLAGPGSAPDVDPAAESGDGSHRGCRLGSGGTALLWSGGFPCQDLSVAGKRAGLGGERSGLAFAFLDLVERHRPRWLLLENVPGLLSSHKGRDMAALLDRLADLGYGVAWDTLDARYFGVPQRRRRIFILATRDPGGRAGAVRAASVLAVAKSSGWHPASGGEAWPGAAAGVGEGPLRIGLDIAGGLTRRYGKGVNTTLDDGAIVVGPSPDPGGVRAPDGLAGRLDDRERVAIPIHSDASRADSAAITPSPDAEGRIRLRDPGIGVGDEGEPMYNLAATGTHGVFVKGKRAQSAEDDESRREDDVSRTLNGFDVGDTRATALVADTLNSGGNDGGFRTEPGAHLAIGGGVADDPLLPLGLDSHRYRCCGNGVVANVAEAIGRALAEEMTNSSGR